MAGKRASQATRGAPEPAQKPAWMWLLSGVVLGLLLSGIVLYKDWLPVLRKGDGPEPNPQAAAPKAGDAGVAAEPAKPEKPKYDFYSVLPEMEVVVPEAEIEAPKDEPAVNADGAARYLLQAGSFKSKDDAEEMKARLALLGLRANVASVEINGTTWHRVRVGPFVSTQDLAEARTTLAGAGISAIALKETR
jgi:cell division protein FtsN